MSESAQAEGDAGELVARLERTAAAYDEARDRVEEASEDRLERLAEHYRKITDLMDRYEERATSDGEGDVDMEAFIEYQEELAHFVEHLPEDLPHRDAFERVDEIMHQKWLKESDFQDARDALSAVRDLVERLDERERTRQRYAEARRDVEVRERELTADIEDLQRLIELGGADLDAPIERLCDPIEAYNDAVTDVFEGFKREASARAVLEFVESTAAFPLVEYRQPPGDLRTYVTDSEAGTETIAQLLEYAEYSRSKLDHYVDDAAELKRNVATHQTYLRRLDGGPLEVSWPPPSASELRWRCKELIPVVDRIAEGDVLSALRTVRSLPDREDYEALRDSAVAQDQLTDDERERLRRGEVQSELDRLEEQRDQLRASLDEHDPR